MPLYLLFFEVDKILVIVENLNIGERAPGSLDLLSSQNVLRLLRLFLLPLLVAAPGPLNLDSSNMVHGKSVILKESSSKRHLVSSLYEARREIPHAGILTLSHHIEW